MQTTWLDLFKEYDKIFGDTIYAKNEYTVTFSPEELRTCLVVFSALCRSAGIAENADEFIEFSAVNEKLWKGLHPEMMALKFRRTKSGAD